MARRNPHMRLEFLGANNAYAFVMGESIVRMDGDDLFFRTKADAKDSAKRHGLKILPTDDVVTLEGDEHIPVPRGKKTMGYAGKRMRSNPAKIHGAHLEALRAGVLPVMQEVAGKVTSMRNRWDCLWEAQRRDPSLGALLNEIYKYANDDNIDTALRGLVKESQTRSNPGVRTWGRAINVKNLQSAFSGGRYIIGPSEAKDLVKYSKTAKADDFLKRASRYLDGYGVEAIFGKYVNSYYQDCVALYVNTGDTYEPTILYDTVAREFGITTMGDFVEVMGDEYEIR